MFQHKPWLRGGDRLFRLFAGTVLLVFALGASPLTAQNYESISISERYLVPTLTGLETSDERAQLSPQISQAKANISEDAGAIQDNLKTNGPRSNNFDRFFQEYLFAEMAQTTDEYLSALGAKRADFLRRYLSPDANGANRIYLIEQLLLPTMKRIAEGNFHPAARLNAVLMVGIANSVEGNSLTNQAPVPNPACVKYLISLAKQEQTPLYLRVGAITGLHRVAQIEGLSPKLEPADSKEITDLAIALVESKVPGQDQWDRDANYWLRRRAVQVLGFLGKPGDNGAVVNALYALLIDQNNEFLVRLDAVDALSQLKYDNAGQARVKEVSEGVTSLASQAMLEQAQKIRSDVEDFIAVNLMHEGAFLLRGGSKRSAGGGSGGRDGDMPGAGAGGLEGGNDEGSQQAKEDPNAPVFDMPNYYLNVERRACKNYVFVCQKFFSKNGKFYSLAQGPERSFIDKASGVLDEVMAKSDMGLVDLAKTDESGKPTDAREKLGGDTQDGPRKGTTWEMVRLFETSGKKLKDFVAEQQKPAEEAAVPATPDTGN